MIDHRILVLRLASQAAEFKLGIQKNFFNPNSIIIHFSKGTELLMNP